jgi:hypothetical protein
MARIEKKGKQTYWLDGQGYPVPVSVIDPQLKARDELVSRLLGRARRLNAVIAREKQLMSEEIAAYLNAVADGENTTWSGGTTLWSFAMDEAVVVKIAKRLQFDEKLNIARQKINECIKNWAPGSNDNLVALVNRAFDVDTKGEVDSRQILGLRQLQIQDDLWLEAMDLIADSMQVQSTKTYFYFQEADENGKMRSITLDFAAL